MTLLDLKQSAFNGIDSETTILANLEPPEIGSFFAETTPGSLGYFPITGILVNF